MTRRKKKQPVKVGDSKVEKESLPPTQLTAITTVDPSNGESTPLGTYEPKLMQNSHHLLEEGGEGDRNGNTLISTQGDQEYSTDLSSHLMRNNCKIQLSKVDVKCATADLVHNHYSDMNGTLEEGEEEHLPGDTQSSSDTATRSDDTLPDGKFAATEDEPRGAEYLASGSEDETGHELVMDAEDNIEAHLEDKIEGAVPPADEVLHCGQIEDEKSYAEFCKEYHRRRRPMEVPDEFICQLCQKVFENPRDLTVHIRGHNESNSHTCNICGKKLSSASSLDRHMLIHSGERPFQCPMCEMSFTTNGNMNRHMRTHDKGASKDEQGKGFKAPTKSSEEAILPGPPSKKAKRDPQQQQTMSDNELTCPVCHKTFICRIGFETHMTFHPDMTQNCAFCNLSFRNQRGLRMHLYKVHRNDSVADKNAITMEAPKDTSTPQKTLGIDDLCIAEFSTKQFPKIAQLWCEENSLTINGDGRSSVCLQCNKAFPCLSSLNLHLNSAHGPKGRLSIKRKTKPKKSGKDGLINGDSTRKSPKDSFMSALCLQPIENDHKRLQRHNSSNDVTVSDTQNDWLKNYVTPDVHSSGLWKGFPKICSDQKGVDVPGRTGRPQPQSFSPLKGEMAESVPQKPFAEYEERMAESGKVKVGHGPLSHGNDSVDIGDTGDIFASANIEGGDLCIQQAMADENGVTWEEEASSGKKYNHVCKFCSKTFPFRSTLKVHVRSHMGLTPYKCMLCEYSSADKSTLVRHMRTHSGERPYSCRLCSFPFTTKANCERHVKKRHGKLSKLDIDVNIQHHPIQRLPEQGQFSSPDTVCKVCNRDFKFFRDLQNHMRIHEQSPKRVYACIKCNMNFSKKNQCVRHMLRKHRHLSSSEIQQHVQKLSRKQENTITKKSHDSNAAKQSLQETLGTFKQMPFSSDEHHLSSLPRPVPVYVNTGYQVFPSDDVQEEPLDLSLPKKGVSPPLFSPDKPSTSMDPQANGTMSFQEDAQASLGASRYKGPYLKFYSPRLDALVCPHCLRLFKKASRLKTHIRSHTKERPFRCSVCSAAFTRSSSLDEHMIKRHCGDGDDLGEVNHGISPMQMTLLKREQLQQQVSILKSCLQPEDEDGSLIAGSDERSSPAISDATMELSSIPKMLAAATTTSFHQYMNSQINHHMLLHQTENVNGDEQEEDDGELMTEDAERDEDEQEGELVIAEYPENQEFETEGDPMKGSRSGKLESRQTCPYCQRKFPWVSSLRRHLITHTGLKPYECPHCGATFSTKSNCERHINRRHQGKANGEVDVAEPTQGEPFKCKECSDVSFSTRRKLQKHYKEEHPSAVFPKEYTEAPDVIVNNKDLIDKIQQGYDPVLSPTITSMIPEGTKKRNQLFFGNNAPNIKEEPLDQQSMDENSSVHSSSLHTNDLSEHHQQPEQEQEEDFLEEMSFEEPGEQATQADDANPFIVKEETEEDGSSHQEVSESPEEQSFPSGLRLGESFSDKGLSEEEEDGNSDSGSLFSVERSSAPTMVGDLSSAASLIIPRVTVTPGKSKKGARYSCEQCCKRFKTEQTLVRHLKVHQLEHPFKCTECTATFTTKFNCQRHIMKLHGKSKDEVVNITGSGKVVEPRRPGNQSSPTAKKLKVSPSLYGSMGSSMVKILPKHRRSSSSKKKHHRHSSKKIKNILPKPDHQRNTQTYEYSGEPATNGKLLMSHDGSMEGAYNGGRSNLTWGYSYTESPAGGSYGTPGISEESAQGVAGLGQSDIIQNLLGIEDSSTMDQLLESADSAAKILGVQG